MKDQPSGSNEIPLEALFTVLSDEYRRIVLSHLLSESEPVSVDELVDHLLDESQLSDEFRRNEVRELITMKLHQIHLPMMEDVGIVEYDPEQNEIETTEAAQEIESSLKQLSNLE